MRIIDNWYKLRLDFYISDDQFVIQRYQSLGIESIFSSAMLRALLLVLLFGVPLLVDGAKKRVKRVKAGKKYTEHEEVHIVVNKVGYVFAVRHFLPCLQHITSVQRTTQSSSLVDRPFNNPTETYRYYSFPFCQVHHDEEDRNLREGANPHNQRLGESIVGDRRETSPYDLTFNDVIDWRVLCKQTLSQADLKKLKNAVHENYFFEMFVEDLPMWGYIGDFTDEDFIIGEIPGSRTYLFSHLHFTIGHNDGQIVSAKVNTDVSGCVCNIAQSILTWYRAIAEWILRKRKSKWRSSSRTQSNGLKRILHGKTATPSTPRMRFLRPLRFIGFPSSIPLFLSCF
jgi:Endomembrane protein 70